jgi:hypothetical protein
MNLNGTKGPAIGRRKRRVYILSENPSAQHLEERKGGEPTAENRYRERKRNLFANEKVRCARVGVAAHISSVVDIQHAHNLL